MVLFDKIKVRFLKLFRQGLSSCELATSLTIAVLATTFPVFGLTTLVITAIAVRKKLNIPFLILITYSLEPLRFLVFIPLTEVGSFILDSPQNLTIETVRQIYNQGFADILMFFAHQLVYAFLGWILIFLPLSYPFFRAIKWSVGFSIPKTKECL